MTGEEKTIPDEIDAQGLMEHLADMDDRQHIDAATAADSEAAEGFPRWGFVAIVVAIAVLGVLALALVRANAPRPYVGTEAPDFTLETLDGETIILSALRGQVVVVNFWASWCEPCKVEAPELEATWRAYRDRGVMFIGVDWLDPESLAAREYLDQFDLTFPNGRDLGEYIGDAYRVSGVPETFVIDQAGIVNRVYIGPIDFVDLRARLDNLVGSES